MPRARVLPALVALLCALGPVACNDPNLVTLGSLVKKGVSETVESGGRTAIDVLWVIDNSGSMCQEQANLAANFRTFVESMSRLDADLQMAVITTDVSDNSQSGRFQNKPARDFRACSRSDARNGRYCLEDADCGEGACLCGIPHIRRCETEEDCGGVGSCIVSGSGSTVRFCSVPCQNNLTCQTAFSSETDDSFWCSQPVEAPPGADGVSYCLLRVCQDDTDCAGDGAYRCTASGLPGDEGVRYCRRFEERGITCPPGTNNTCPLSASHRVVCGNDGTCPRYAECPAPTCDCPHHLDKVLSFRSGGDDALDDAVRAFRCMATVGTEGDSIERGLGALRLALSSALIEEQRRETGVDFPREEAHLVIVVVTDEDDCTGDQKFLETTSACDKQGNLECVWCRDELEEVEAIAEFVQARKRSPFKVAVAAIVGDDDGVVVQQPTEPSESCTSLNGKAFSGRRYARFAEQFDKLGVVESICSDSFEGPLARIGELVTSLRNRFCLTSALRECRKHADCGPEQTCGWYWGNGGQCVVDAAYMGALCQDDADCEDAGATCDNRRICLDAAGEPAQLQVRVRRKDSPGWEVMGSDGWQFIPNRGAGCLRFSPASAPGPEDAIDIRYISMVR